MNKKIIIIIAVVVIAIIAIYLLAGGEKLGGQKTIDNQDKDFAEQMTDIVASGKPYQCTWQDQDNNTGQVYGQGDKYYMEVTEGEAKYYVIMDEDQCMWTWEDQNTQGLKFCYTETEVEPSQETEETDASTESAPKWQETKASNVEYSCQEASIDQGLFTPPADIQFLSQEDYMFGY